MNWHWTIVLLAITISCTDQQENGDEAHPGSGVDNTSTVERRSISNLAGKEWLSDLHSEINKTPFTEGSSYADAPGVVRTFLDSLINDLRIADPGEDWQVGCMRIEVSSYDSATGETVHESPSLPSRQMIYLGLSPNMTLLSYYTGGAAKTGHIMVIVHDENSVTDFWASQSFDVTGKASLLKFLYGFDGPEEALHRNTEFL